MFVAPEPVVVVTTASRGPAIGDPSAATTVIGQSQIETAPAQTPDQLLHDVPVIALPRNDSHTLHPTGQSVSMRGLGRGGHWFSPMVFPSTTRSAAGSIGTKFRSTKLSEPRSCAARHPICMAAWPWPA